MATAGAIAKHVAPVSLLAILLYAPPEALQKFLSSKGIQSSWVETARPVVRVLLGLGIVRALNRALNAWATNNWRVSASTGWDWLNEVAVVTGGSGGIGTALVKGLTRKGVRVAVLDLQELPAELKANDKVTFFKCDVTSTASVNEVAEAVRQKLGNPSILINNAGIVGPNTILEITEDSLRKVIGVNLMSMWFTTKAFLPHMLAQDKGHIVTVASLASYIALPVSVEYSATKAGALAFHEGLTCELKHNFKKRGIVTTVVHPSYVATAMTKNIREKVERGMGRKMLNVEDVSKPVLAQVFSGRGAQIVVPSGDAYLTTLRAWPNWTQELLRDKFGRMSASR